MMLLLRCVLCLVSFEVVDLENLIVNIANQGGDIFQERFEVNSTEDTLTLSFQQFDGTLIKHFVDFKTGIQTFRITILPFRELGETVKKEICFLLSVETGEYISTDAMSKLRQTNPRTIRRPEGENSPVTVTMDQRLSLESISKLPGSVQALCSPKTAQVFAQHSNLSAWNLSEPLYDISAAALTACNETVAWRDPCYCSFAFCVVWYPCDLKYCKNEKEKDAVEFRCGIKTCKQCRTFVYPVANKMDCLWNLFS